MTAVTTIIIIIAMLLGTFVILAQAWMFTRMYKDMELERDRLMDRIQAPTLREYKAVVAEPKPRPLKAPDEVITPL